jgi:hypothetical protein
MPYGNRGGRYSRIDHPQDRFPTLPFGLLSQVLVAFTIEFALALRVVLWPLSACR